MNNDFQRAVHYAARVAPAREGCRNDELNKLAFALLERFDLSEIEHLQLCDDWGRRCSPPIAEGELQATVRSAWSGAHGRGVTLTKARTRTNGAPAAGSGGKRGRFTFRDRLNQAESPAPLAADPGRSEPDFPVGRYDGPGQELPKPLDDPTRRLLNAAFREGEGVRIALAHNGDDGREVPKGAGITLSREEWLARLDKAAGNPNQFLRTPDRNGIFCSVNPLQVGGSKDRDVTAFRHVLLEFDEISIKEQWRVLSQSRVPCTAIISSGGKSVHAWVRVDAKDREEYRERVAVLWHHFSDYKPDQKNRNPSRFSRLPGCERGDRRQELLAVNIGADSWQAWESEQLLDSLTPPITVGRLDAFKPEEDPNNLLGKRWLGKGMACLLVGPSGVGKSSLNMQLAFNWALGLDAFGIKPVRKLKSLVVQAENDEGDLAEMFQGMRAGLGYPKGCKEDSDLEANLVFQRDSSHTGTDFCNLLQRLIEKHRPDIVWLDPILSFVGADISRQDVVGQFFRNQLNPILDVAGVVCFVVHHTGKPPSDKDARRHWQTSDYAYAGLGSSDLTNWARAALILRQIKADLFELRFAKRGKRAGVPGERVFLKHAEQVICWEQTAAPDDDDDEAGEDRPRRGNRQAKAERKKSIPEKVCEDLNTHSFLAGCTAEGESQNAIRDRLIDWLVNGCNPRQAPCGKSSARDAIFELTRRGKLSLHDGKYFRGPDNAATLAASQEQTDFDAETCGDDIPLF